MSKYNSLGNYLYRTDRDSISLTFKEIEDILGFKLPKYLRDYVAGWYGTPEGSPTHVQKAVWYNAGYQVESVSLFTETVKFIKL